VSRGLDLGLISLLSSWPSTNVATVTQFLPTAKSSAHSGPGIILLE